MDRETLIDVARTSLRTKVHAELADVLTEVCIKHSWAHVVQCMGKVLVKTCCKCCTHRLFTGMLSRGRG
jgi:hypothetical protein